MKTLYRVMCLAALCGVVSTNGDAHAQSITSKLSSVKVGQWIQLEGTMQKDMSFLCSEVKILTGDFMDDDWGIRGLVSVVEPNKSQFSIARFTVQVKPDAEYDDDLKVLKRFADVKTGMLIEVEGTYMKDGTFVAKEVENQAEKLAKKPAYYKKVQIVGRVEKVDPTKRSITAMNTTFLLGDRTQFKSVIK